MTADVSSDRVFEIVEGPRRRRRARATQANLSLVALAFGLVLPFLPFLPLQRDRVDLVTWYSLMGPVAVVLGYSWYYNRQHVRSINQPAITAEGLYPPFKPKPRLSSDDWFVPYKDIALMVPVAQKKAFVPAYDVTLRDGLTFQLNALDLLLYVDEKEVRRYAKMLALVKEELELPESRARAERGEDVVIPKERFQSALKAWKPAQEAPGRSMFWYFVLIGLVAGFVAAFIIGFGILR